MTYSCERMCSLTQANRKTPMRQAQTRPHETARVHLSRCRLGLAFLARFLACLLLSACLLRLALPACLRGFRLFHLPPVVCGLPLLLLSLECRDLLADFLRLLLLCPRARRLRCAPPFRRRRLLPLLLLLARLLLFAPHPRRHFGRRRRSSGRADRSRCAGRRWEVGKGYLPGLPLHERLEERGFLWRLPTRRGRPSACGGRRLRRCVALRRHGSRGAAGACVRAAPARRGLSQRRDLVLVSSVTNGAAFVVSWDRVRNTCPWSQQSGFDTRAEIPGKRIL